MRLSYFHAYLFHFQFFIAWLHSRDRDISAPVRWMDGSGGSCDVAEGDRVMERAGSDFMAAQIRTDRREAIVSRLPGSIHNQAHPRDQGDSCTFSFRS